MEYFTNTINGKPHRVDIHSLMIDGKPAHEMKVEQVYAALVKMDCPRILPTHAKPDLLVRYGVWLQELEQKKR